MADEAEKPPAAFERMVDRVLAYRPEKQRKKQKRAKLAKKTKSKK